MFFRLENNFSRDPSKFYNVSRFIYAEIKSSLLMTFSHMKLQCNEIWTNRKLKELKFFGEHFNANNKVLNLLILLVLIKFFN